MRAALITLAILLLPAALLAQPSIGIYFTGGTMTHSPAQWDEFDGYVLLNNFPCYVTAAEFMVSVPAGITYLSFAIPEGSLSLGNPVDGLSMTYWPPLNGFEGGSSLLCSLHFLARKGCGAPGGIVDAPLAIVADPNAVPDPGVLATCYPDNEIHQLVGLTSIICPEQISVQSKSWGAIKNLYEN